MDKSVARLTTPEECEQFAENVAEKHPELAREAFRKAVELRAAAFGAPGEAEEQAIRAVYAYEEVLSRRKGRKIRATRTWQMIDRHGIIGAVERAVNRPDDAAGYDALVKMGMRDFTFEAVVARHPGRFTSETVHHAKERMGRRGEPT